MSFFQSGCYCIKGWQWQRATVTTCKIISRQSRGLEREIGRKRKTETSTQVNRRRVNNFSLCERYFQRISSVTCHAKIKSIFINSSIPRLSMKKTQSSLRATKSKMNRTNRYSQSLFYESFMNNKEINWQ